MENKNEVNNIVILEVLYNRDQAPFETQRPTELITYHNLCVKELRKYVRYHLQMIEDQKKRKPLNDNRNLSEEELEYEIGLFED